MCEMVWPTLWMVLGGWAMCATAAAVLYRRRSDHYRRLCRDIQDLWPHTSTLKRKDCGEQQQGWLP